MTKTLRVRERTGWTTKPVEDLDENRLTAEEVDDNFLALEDATIPPGGTTGQVLAKASAADHATEWVSPGVQSVDFTTISKVTELPATPDANTLYIVVEATP